jgi:hypothetical protein
MSMAEASRVLRWVQPKWNHRRYELRDESDSLVAALDYRGKWRTKPTLSFEGEELAFQGRGFLKINIAIMRDGQEIALYKPKSMSGEISFMNGRKFVLRRKGFFKTEHIVTAADNEEVMSLKRTPRFLRAECAVTLSPSAYKYPETRVLMALAWYQMLASAQAATAAAT